MNSSMIYLFMLACLYYMFDWIGPAIRVPCVGRALIICRQGVRVDTRSHVHVGMTEPRGDRRQGHAMG